MHAFTRLTLWQFAFVVFFLIALIRFILMLPLGLVEDEAYYWLWAQVPSAGYFDHTAGVGLLGWLWQQIFGLDFLSIRVLNGLLSLVTGFSSLAACLALMPRQQRNGQLSLPLVLMVLVLALTAVQAVHVAWVPDALYLPCLSLAVWQICRLLGPYDHAGDWQRPKDAWVWAGLFFGLSLLAKELVVLYAVLFCLFAVFHHKLREDMRTSIWPWLGLLFIIAGGLPTLVWNAQNDWILLSYQSGHAFVDRSTDLEWQDLSSLATTYLILLGPAFALALPYLRSTWSSHWPLWALFAFPSLGFFVIALINGLQTQWALPSIHIGLLLLLPLTARSKSLWRFGPLMGALFFSTLLYLVLAVRSIGLQAHNVQPVLVWEDVYTEIRATQDRAESELGEPVLLLGNRYQEASLLNYSRVQEDGFIAVTEGPAEQRNLLPSLNHSFRSNHYDYLWPELALEGYMALVVIRSGLQLPDEMFSEVLEMGTWTPAETISYHYTLGRLAENPRPQVKD